MAALIALAGVLAANRTKRRNDLKQQWWDRARWALDLILDEREEARDVGYSAIFALAQSEYAKIHERDIIDAAVSAALEQFASNQHDAPADQSSSGPGGDIEAELSADDEGEA